MLVSPAIWNVAADFHNKRVLIDFIRHFHPMYSIARWYISAKTKGLNSEYVCMTRQFGDFSYSFRFSSLGFDFFTHEKPSASRRCFIQIVHWGHSHIWLPLCDLPSISVGLPDDQRYVAASVFQHQRIEELKSLLAYKPWLLVLFTFPRPICRSQKSPRGGQ